MKVTTPGGEVIDLGTTETTPTIGIKDYSRRVTDDYGVTTVVPRNFSRRMTVRLGVAVDAIDALQRRLADLRATSALWVADRRYAALSVQGFFSDFSIDLPGAPLSYCSLTIEGLSENEALPDNGADPAPYGRSTMQVLAPIAITDASLVASSVSETDYAAWSNATSYGKGARVILAATHRIYESAVDGNAGADPAGTSGKWLDVGPTNRWAMFDQALGSSTTAQGSIVVTVTAAAIGAIALLDVVGATVRVQTASYDRTVPVGAGATTFLDLPPATTRATVTITGAGTVSVGTLLAGKVVGLGITEAGAGAGITDYSRKVVDDFGEVTIVERAWAKRMTAKTLINTTAIDAVFGRLAAVRATPVLWMGSKGLDSLTIYGFFKDFSIEVGETLSKVSLSIEGLSTAGKVEPFAPGGGSVAWPDITDPDGTKPKPNADKTSENVAKDTAAVAGKPATEVVAALGKIEPLGLAVIDQEALTRQRDRDIGQMSDTLMRALLENDRARVMMRDAGVVIDPASGKARIYGIDATSERVSQVEIALDATKSSIRLLASSEYVDQQIARAQLDPTGKAALDQIIAQINQAQIEIDGLEARVSLKADATILTTLTGTVTQAVVDIDALEAAIDLKASRTTVDQIDTRVMAAELKLSTLGDVASLSIAVRQARYAGDTAATGALASLLTGDEQHRRVLRSAAEARQELSTDLAQDRAALAQFQQVVTVEVGDTKAAVERADRARIEGDRVAAQSIEQVSAALGTERGRITATREVLIGPDGTTVRALTALDANGRIVGVVQTATGERGDYVVVSDTFAVVDPVTGKPLFFVDQDGAIAASFKRSAIGFDNLEMGAAQRSAWYPVQQDVSVGRGVTVQIVSLTFDKIDADSALKICFYGNIASPDDLQFTGAIAIDGAIVQPVEVNIVLDTGNSAGRMPITPFAFVPGIAAGRHTVTFTLTNTETDNVPLTVRAGSTLEVTELRKASLGSVTGSGAIVISPGGGSGSGGGTGSGGTYDGGGGIRPAQPNQQ